MLFDYSLQHYYYYYYYYSLAIILLVGESGNFSGRSHPGGWNLQRDLAAFAQKNIDCLLGVLLERGLHIGNLLIGFLLELRRGISLGPSLGQHHVVKFFLLLGLVGGDEVGAVGLGLLHAVSAACVCPKQNKAPNMDIIQIESKGFAREAFQYFVDCGNEKVIDKGWKKVIG